MSKKEDKELAEKIVVGLFEAIFLVLWSFLWAWPIVWVWNYVMPTIFGLPNLSYWQAFWTYLVLKSLWVK